MSRTIRILREVPRTDGGRVLVLLLALLLAYHLWIEVTAPGRIAEGVGQDADRYGRFAVDVELDFPPERFHILRLQAYGRVRGTTGTVLHLRAVTRAGVDALARTYWIEEIRPAVAPATAWRRSCVPGAYPGRCRR
ncbi:hypothetical protein [Amycolatopsis cihanbeyliensis]|uniref:Uncharacterized protein n=1 Tax=Amycolatopsis cihanbeyliensis TaxID=1128664 RepID=A0A542DFT9_AMYCI|nr:hypothetical protein [Amycolatopsis cihanbeyliensis]TQJ01955.1 hypothetical protein FB471_1671 [Amycolatopsis cihanbeyliensis]